MPFRMTRIKELWNDEKFIREAVEIAQEIISQNIETPQMITYIANYFGDEDEKGIIASYILGSINLYMLSQQSRGEKKNEKEKTTQKKNP